MLEARHIGCTMLPMLQFHFKIDVYKRNLISYNHTWHATTTKKQCLWTNDKVGTCTGAIVTRVLQVLSIILVLMPKTGNCACICKSSWTFPRLFSVSNVTIPYFCHDIMQESLLFQSKMNILYGLLFILSPHCISASVDPKNLRCLGKLLAVL
jgi:hypothetical protein